MVQTHPLHMIFPSPWPLFTGVCFFLLVFNSTVFFKTSSNTWALSILFVCILAFQWWRDVNRETFSQGFHSNLVMKNVRWGMILFIVSEILFFFSFFWAFFHVSLSPEILINNQWSPAAVNPLNPFQVPLLNTLVLLSSGVTVTLSHHLMLKSKMSSSSSLLWITIILGVNFTALQLWEYGTTSFSFSDSVFGSSFFIATGFHGLHVLIGSLLLFFSAVRLSTAMVSSFHHSLIENSIWYWHFVDVVWLFLFCFVYWWAF